MAARVVDGFHFLALACLRQAAVSIVGDADGIFAAPCEASAEHGVAACRNADALVRNEHEVRTDGQPTLNTESTPAPSAGDARIADKSVRVPIVRAYCNTGTPCCQKTTAKFIRRSATRSREIPVDVFAVEESDKYKRIAFELYAKPKVADADAEIFPRTAHFL